MLKWQKFLTDAKVIAITNQKGGRSDYGVGLDGCRQSLHYADHTNAIVRDIINLSKSGGRKILKKMADIGCFLFGFRLETNAREG